MMFAQDGNIEKALIDSIAISLVRREREACSTWNPESVLAVAWGVKEIISAENVEAVKSYIQSVIGKSILIADGVEVVVLEGDVKEQKGQFILIYRYQLQI